MSLLINWSMGYFKKVRWVNISQQYLLSPVWITKNCFLNFQVYILNKAQIDPVLDKVKAQFDEISGKVFAMIPQAKPAEKTE